MLESYVFEVFQKIFLYERFRRKWFRSTLNLWNAAYIVTMGTDFSEIGLPIK